MKVIKNKILPPKGFFAINLFNIILVRRDSWEKAEQGYPWFIDRMLNHESIHTAQMKDFCKFILIGGIFFYLVYFSEWLFRIIYYRFNNDKAYSSMSFEVEAKTNESDHHYLDNRKHFAQWIR